MSPSLPIDNAVLTPVFSEPVLDGHGRGSTRFLHYLVTWRGSEFRIVPVPRTSFLDREQYEQRYTLIGANLLSHPDRKALCADIDVTFDRLQTTRAGGNDRTMQWGVSYAVDPYDDALWPMAGMPLSGSEAPAIKGVLLYSLLSGGVLLLGTMLVAWAFDPTLFVVKKFLTQLPFVGRPLVGACGVAALYLGGRGALPGQH